LLCNVGRVAFTDSFKLLIGFWQLFVAHIEKSPTVNDEVDDEQVYNSSTQAMQAKLNNEQQLLQTSIMRVGESQQLEHKLKQWQQT